MAEDLDVEAMLEAPYKKEDNHDASRSEKKKSSRRHSEDRKRSRSKERRDKSNHREHETSSGHDRHREKDRGKEKDRHDRSHDGRHSRDGHRRSRSRERERERVAPRRSRSRERVVDRSRVGPRDRHTSRYSPPARPTAGPGKPGIRSLNRYEQDPGPEMTPEERDARTVVCMQLSAKIRPRDLEEFFSSVGKVRDVRLITDNKTRRSKGIAYIEFVDVATVPLALNLSGQKLLEVPILVTVSQAEKNRAAGGGAMSVMRGQVSGPMRLYVGSLHFNITEDMLRGIFEPFGKIEHINLVLDPETNRSKGYGFVTFHSAEDAMKAMQQLNGFELAGRPMKVGNVTERTGDIGSGSALDSDEMDRAGFDLGATGRLQLMAKLAEGTGFQLPTAAQNALQFQQQATGSIGVPPIATQCFMLSNMFDPVTEANPNFDAEIRDDVIEECNKHGGILHIYVDKTSPQGNVYVKCPSIASAVSSVQSLHGRWFAGKMITAAYVPLPNYHQLFAEAQRAAQLLMPTARIVPGGFNQVS